MVHKNYYVRNFLTLRIHKINFHGLLGKKIEIILR